MTNPDVTGALWVIRCGLVPYEAALAHQRTVHAEVVAGRAANTVLLLEHPSVYTAGKRTEVQDRPLDGTPVIDVDRGGKITWHGPGQLVGYPIVRLIEPVDVVAYVHRLEAMMIAVCGDLGVLAHRVQGRSGVWVGSENSGSERKLGAIGVRVARNVTMHGFALNCNPDLSHYDRFVPCGITDAGVSSLSKELGHDISVGEVLSAVERRLPTVVGPGAAIVQRIA